ncbi:MAG: right-handed parallel beta-helix repeat-containing protein, partial [Nanoarchaeota archaeon]
MRGARSTAILSFLLVGVLLLSGCVSPTGNIARDVNVSEAEQQNLDDLEQWLLQLNETEDIVTPVINATPVENRTANATDNKTAPRANLPPVSFGSSTSSSGSGSSGSSSGAGNDQQIDPENANDQNQQEPLSRWSTTLPGQEKRTQERREQKEFRILADEDELPLCNRTLNNLTGCQMNQSLTLKKGVYDISESVDITADNVVLDCNGSTVLSNHGISLILNINHSNVTVKNCILKPYWAGIYTRADRNATQEVTGIELINNTFIHNDEMCKPDEFGRGRYCNQAIYIERVKDSTIQANRLLNLSGVTFGIKFYKSNNVLLTDNFFHGMKGNDIQMWHSYENLIRNNTFVNGWRYAPINTVNATFNTFELNTFYMSPSILEKNFSDNTTFDYGEFEYDYEDNTTLLYNITEVMDNKDNISDYPFATSIAIESGSHNNLIRYNHIYDMGSIGILIRESNNNNVTYNYVHDIVNGPMDNIDYWWPRCMQATRAVNTSITYNTFTKAKAQGLYLYQSNDTVVHYNNIHRNNKEAHWDEADIVIDNARRIDFRYNNIDTDATCYPWVREEIDACSRTNLTIEKSVSNKNRLYIDDWYGDVGVCYPVNHNDWDRAQTCSLKASRTECLNEYLCEWNYNKVAGPFEADELLVKGKGALDAEHNWWGSTDTTDWPTYFWENGEQTAIPRRIYDFEDDVYRGKVYWGTFLTEAVDIYCDQDADGDGFFSESDKTMMPHLSCIGRKPESDHPFDCADQGSDCINPTTGQMY